jgi:hypothetical protein
MDIEAIWMDAKRDTNMGGMRYKCIASLPPLPSSLCLSNAGITNMSHHA